MKISRQQLHQAAIEGILSPGQAESLYHYLKRQPGTGPVFNFTHILYYLGGLTAIGAMTLFMNLGWEEFDGHGGHAHGRCCQGRCGNCLPHAARPDDMPRRAFRRAVVRNRIQSVDGAAFSSSQLTTASTSASLLPWNI